MQTMPRDSARVSGSLQLRAGDLVEVRSAAEILATLDELGELDGLPFMPEMLRYCGHQFTVASVAHKTCDTIGRTGMYKMADAVHLTGAAARCDGSDHGGCQAACLMYWKTSWLRRVDRPVEGVVPDSRAAADAPRLLPLLVKNSRRPAEDDTELYRCQATEMNRAAPVRQRVLDLTSYIRDVRSGNRNIGWVLRSFLVSAFNRIQAESKQHLPLWLQFREGLSWQFLRGRATGGRTPSEILDLQPGELVRIKSKAEIEKTLNADQLNRGLGFEAEMARFCGRTARVARRVTQIIDERTGAMLTLRNPCIVLEGIVCEGAYHMVCPRSIPAYWREIWLERVPE